MPGAADEAFGSPVRHATLASCPHLDPTRELAEALAELTCRASAQLGHGDPPSRPLLQDGPLWEVRQPDEIGPEIVRDLTQARAMLSGTFDAVDDHAGKRE